MNKNTIPPIVQAILAAILFGASAPISKIFLGEIEPIPLAAFLYLGSGLGLFVFHLLQRKKTKVDIEAPIQRSDLVWLAGAILAGGVIAPIILLFGLRYTPGATASLLLNFEGVATTLIAALVFNEAVSRQAWWAILIITTASILLSVTPTENWGISLGAFGVLAACVFWGIDNNFTRNISAKNPVSIVMIKGFAAGSFSLILSMLLGHPIPGIQIIIKAMILGSLSYGLSITLFIRAMRGLGAARTSALFGTAPLSGVVLSILLLQESVNTKFLIALPLMVVGAFLLVYEEHDHNHVHEDIMHEHWHEHEDEHHHHIHKEAESTHSHSHEHRHEHHEHSHHHMPDIHHRHKHSTEG
jgi:drug/metabolite transporter (DMT)-like permease